jgi:hypothetical protein
MGIIRMSYFRRVFDEIVYFSLNFEDILMFMVINFAIYSNHASSSNSYRFSYNNNNSLVMKCNNFKHVTLTEQFERMATDSRVCNVQCQKSVKLNVKNIPIQYSIHAEQKVHSGI